VSISAGLESDTGEDISTVSEPGEPRLVVAVDGPSGAGKSSASRGAAVALGLRYLDTGPCTGP
jgi:tRNA A37 threonylcarbamoyladenosine biosynthesis protein TsaE